MHLTHLPPQPFSTPPLSHSVSNFYLCSLLPSSGSMLLPVTLPQTFVSPLSTGEAGIIINLPSSEHEQAYPKLPTGKAGITGPKALENAGFHRHKVHCFEKRLPSGKMENRKHTSDRYRPLSSTSTIWLRASSVCGVRATADTSHSLFVQVSSCLWVRSHLHSCLSASKPQSRKMNNLQSDKKQTPTSLFLNSSPLKNQVSTL